MVAVGSTPPLAGEDSNIRKRVCKACDRCRLKKSKCDGSTPCSRCKADDTICVFGERKKSHDKAYPKGYVEMLEQQQSQLMYGLQEATKRLEDADAWPGSPLDKSQHGHPLMHDILERLGALKKGPDGSAVRFEEDTEVLQARLFAEGRGTMQREISSEGEGASPHSNASYNFEVPASTTFPPAFDDPFAALSPSTPQDNLNLSMHPSNPRKRPAPGPLEMPNYGPEFAGFPSSNGFPYPPSRLSVNTGIDNNFLNTPAYETPFSGFYSSPNTINPNWIGREWPEDGGFSYGSTAV